MTSVALPDLFPLSERAAALRERVARFMDAEVYPNEAAFHAHTADPVLRWTVPPLIEDLKKKARAAGLWNLFLPDAELGAGLTNLEYASIAELTGRVLFAPEVFNCNAPDTGNIEVLYHFGSPMQRERWMKPLLAGEIRSAFAMTEPDVASSDATNIAARIRRDGDHYIVDAHKWWTTGATDPRCQVFIVMGVTDPDAAPHARHAMILVPRDAPGVEVVRPLTVFGYDDAPHGHAETRFDNVRVPVENLILGEGRGFEIAQGRLGPGRIHHCMRLIGLAQRALEAMVARAGSRVAFGRPLASHGMAQEAIALSRCEIEQARLLVLSAAAALDRHGNKGARDAIAMIKIVAPRMACAVIDRAMQIHGAAGLSDDLFLAHGYAAARALRLADGPDEVHMVTLAKNMSR
jgi:acyl-CoA dehydrogenase